MKSTTSDGGRITLQISQNCKYYCRIASEFGHAGEYLQGLEFIEKALSIDPDHADAWQIKGLFLDEIGKSDESLASYDEALRIDPYNAETWYNKGNVLKKIGREEEAHSCFNRGIDLALGR